MCWHNDLSWPHGSPLKGISHTTDEDVLSNICDKGERAK